MIARLTLAALRGILRLYPAFRDRFADDVIASVAGELRRAGEAGRLASLAVAVRALADALGGIVPERRGAGPAVNPLSGITAAIVGGQVAPGDQRRRSRRPSRPA